MIQTQIKCYLHKTNFSWMSKWIIYWSLVATPAGCTVCWCKIHDDCNPCNCHNRAPAAKEGDREKIPPTQELEIGFRRHIYSGF